MSRGRGEGEGGAGGAPRIAVPMGQAPKLSPAFPSFLTPALSAATTSRMMMGRGGGGVRRARFGTPPQELKKRRRSVFCFHSLRFHPPRPPGKGRTGRGAMKPPLPPPLSAAKAKAAPPPASTPTPFLSTPRPPLEPRRHARSVLPKRAARPARPPGRALTIVDAVAQLLGGAARAVIERATARHDSRKQGRLINFARIVRRLRRQQRVKAGAVQVADGARGGRERASKVLAPVGAAAVFAQGELLDVVLDPGVLRRERRGGVL